MRIPILLVGALAIAGLPLQVVAEPRPEPGLFDAEGYRIDRYRAPVPDAPEGVRRVRAGEVRALMAKGEALVIDAMPATGAGYDPETGEWRLSERHEHIPGTLWYPEVGRGRLDPVISAWFKEALRKGSRGDRTTPIVFYCRADCWMSWNAAMRARSWGYANVLWFPEGIEGWAEAGLPLATATPERITGAVLATAGAQRP